MRPQDHQSFTNVSPGMGRFTGSKDMTPFSKFLSSYQDQSPCIGRQFQKALSFGQEDFEMPLLNKFVLRIRESPNFEDQSGEQKAAEVSLYPRITRQFQSQQEEKVCKKLDFTQFASSKSPMSKLPLFNSPRNNSITAKKGNSYASPRMDQVFDELPTAQRVKWKEKMQNQEVEEDELQCSEPDFEEEQQPRVRAQSRSPARSDRRAESMSFSDQSGPGVHNRKHQYLNLITLKKKPKEPDTIGARGKRSGSGGFEVNLASTTRKGKRKAVVVQAPAVAVAAIATKAVVCNCKRSKCLKLYCDCFAIGQNCGKDCNCQGCSNNDAHSEEREQAIKQIVDRNPNAFRSKAEGTQPEGGGDQARHFKGCNCKKSNCLKKYCECYTLNVKCSELCKCEECKNQDVRRKGGVYNHSFKESKSKGHKLRNEDLSYNRNNKRVKLH